MPRRLPCPPVQPVEPCRTTSYAARAAAILLAFALAGCGATGNGEAIHVAEDWQYQWGDSPRSPDGSYAWASESFTASGWHSLRLPAQPPGREDRTFLWMRVRLPADLAPGSSVSLQFVDQEFEAFVDGKRVLQFGDPDAPAKAEYGRPWHIIPLGGDAAGKVLALRIYSGASNIGVAGRAYLGQKSDLVERIIRVGVLPFAVGVFCFAVGAFAAMLFLGGRQWMLLVLAALSLGTGVYAVANAYSPMKQLVLDRPSLWWRLDLGSLYLLPAAYFGFFCQLLDGRYRRAFRLCSFAFLAYAAIALAGSAVGLFPLGKTLFPFEVMLTVGLVLAIATAAVSARRGDVDSIIFLIGFTAVAVTGARDSLVDMRAIPGEQYACYWGFLVLLACLSALVMRRYGETLRTLATYSGELKTKNEELVRARERIAAAALAIEQQAETIHSSAHQQFEVSSRQAAAVDETGATASQIAQISKEASDRAQSVIAVAARSEQLSRDGQRLVEQSVAGIERLSTQVQTIAERITDLSKQAVEIGEIVATVRDLAEQSNLLALNAAIEAAKAGDDGRGFAVVAREIRQMAEQSRGGALRVRELLERLQKGMRAAVQATEQGWSSTGATVALAHSAGGAIAGLAEVIEESARAARQIGASTRQQTEGVEQIVTAVGDVSAAMADALDGTRRIEEVARTLTALSRDLSQLVAATPNEPGSAAAHPARGGPAAA